MKLHYMIKRDGQLLEAWQNWKEEIDCTEQEKQQANLRTLKNNEVVLDIDAPNALDKLGQIVSRLNAENYSFEVWETGSEGYHINLIFPEMA